MEDFKKEELVTRIFSEDWTALCFTEVNGILLSTIDQEEVKWLKLECKFNEE